jgi:uncharacterized membrane protein
MSPSVLLAALNYRIEPTRKNLGWVVMFLMGLFVLALVEIPYLNPHGGMRPHHLEIRWLLLPHLLAGSVALLWGPVQFSSRMRRRYPRVHRILGRFYVGAVLIAAPLAISIPIYLRQDKFYIAGTIAHAGTWFVSTLVAFLIARNRHIPQHRQWMIRSYALTFSFVIVRVFSKFFPLPDPVFGIVDVIVTLLVLLASDIGMNWQELARRRASTPALQPLPDILADQNAAPKFPDARLIVGGRGGSGPLRTKNPDLIPVPSPEENTMS